VVHTDVHTDVHADVHAGVHSEIKVSLRQLYQAALLDSLAK